MWLESGLWQVFYVLQLCVGGFRWMPVPPSSPVGNLIAEKQRVREEFGVCGAACTSGGAVRVWGPLFLEVLSLHSWFNPFWAILHITWQQTGGSY